MIWGSDCHVTISYRDVKIIILNFILFKYICILIYKQYQNNEKNVMMKFSWGPSTGWKFKKSKRCMPFCLCPPDVMFVTRGSKNSLFFIFDSLSNLDCGQWYKFWIYQSHPMSALATQSVDSRARASFSLGHFCVHSFFCWMVEHFLLRIATHRRDSQGGKLLSLRVKHSWI